MQAASDIFLGWTQDEASARHFYIRQLKNRRLASISELVEENALINYARLCGRTLARAHARSGDPAVLAGYMGKSGAFDDAPSSFAMAYADRTQKYYDQLAKWKRNATSNDEGTDESSRMVFAFHRSGRISRVACILRRARIPLFTVIAGIAAFGLRRQQYPDL